jgi:branched-chain amino acid transport system substrate-binding protein
VAIIHEEASFGEAVALAFGEVWASEFSGTLQLFGYGAGNTAELRTRIADVGGVLDQFQAVLVLGQVDEMTVFMTTATDNPAYPDDIPLYFGDTGVNREIFAEASSPRLFDNVLAATAEPPPSFVYNSYRDAFRERYDVDPHDSSFTANAYDAMWLMALGATWATFNGDGALDDGRHEVDGLNITRGLRKTTGGMSEIRFIRTEWPGGVAQFMAGRAIDVIGASGNHDWDLRSEEAPGPTALFQADAQGNLTLVTLVEP